MGEGMTEQKKPQAGEWWFNADGERVYVIGTRSNGQYMFENNQNRIWPWCGDWSDWHHEPDCTGWDWQPAPVESPDDWVTQDRVPPRQGVDQCRWEPSDKFRLVAGEWETMHGGKLANGWQLEVRCRRKDLPPMPEKPKTRKITVCEIVYWDHEHLPHFERVSLHEVGDFKDGWKYVHVYETREIEVPA